ncbi:MAG: hypothetical protein IRZ33_07535 [Alicyclobacillaceae bacterium]|nr:hypothetical protein [Alicyclobacillaceae bacterium]
MNWKSIGTTWLVLAALAAGTGGAGGVAQAQAKAVFTATPGHWVAKGTSAKTADLLVIAGYKNVNNGMSFNGYANGQLKVTIPLGWKVNVKFENPSPIPHSVMIVPAATKGKATGFTPAFPHAETPNPSRGYSGKGAQMFTFTASKAGTYLIWCGVPGHGIAGMYDTLVVSKSARAPSFSA